MISKLINKSINEIAADKIITFNKGIPGFEELRKFAIVEIEDNEIFYLLQSIENKEIAIVVVSPFNVDTSYEVNLDENIVRSLNINSENQVLMLNTVTLNSDTTKITTNLAAPLIINIEDKIGEQIILNSDKYKIKTSIFKE